MSLICPFCGKNKLKDSLFCDNCSKKINSDFEINIHENNDLNLNKSVVSEQSKEKPEDKELSERSFTIDSDTKVAESNDFDTIENNFSKKSEKVGRSLFWILIGVILLIVAFLLYNKTILSKNLERRAWESAVNENSVSGYLAYIESQPNGIHFDEAQAGLMQLKGNEAITWERLKISVNLEEFVNFSRQNENSPYMPLVREKIDSLSWMSALKLNSVESYSEYINNSQSGSLNGDYMFEASKRYEMLFQSTPVISDEMDSIRSTVNGFYTSLSGINHAGIYNYLAPEVYRFFDSGGVTRERIAGELMITAAQAGGQRINFKPNLEALMCEKEPNGSYKVNVPVVKSYSEGGSTVYLPGYINHLELNMNFEVRSIYETKPFPGAL